MYLYLISIFELRTKQLMFTHLLSIPKAYFIFKFQIPHYQWLIAHLCGTPNNPSLYLINNPLHAFLTTIKPSVKESRCATILFTLYILMEVTIFLINFLVIPRLSKVLILRRFHPLIT